MTVKRHICFPPQDLLKRKPLKKFHFVTDKDAHEIRVIHTSCLCTKCRDLKLLEYYKEKEENQDNISKTPKDITMQQLKLFHNIPSYIT